jgi:DNA-directed RNA polymerase
LPVGLDIVQSYLATETQKIEIFEFSKKVLNFTVPKKDMIALNKKLNKQQDDKEKKKECIYDKRKQMRALMPNLIHSLDATSMFLLYEEFIKNYGDIVNLYTIHDCFATTADKGEKLLILIRSIYTKLYIENSYLRTFDEGIIYIIQQNLSKDNVK